MLKQEKKEAVKVAHISKRFFNPAPLEAFNFELPADTAKGKNPGEKTPAQSFPRCISVLNDVSFTL